MATEISVKKRVTPRAREILQTLRNEERDYQASAIGAGVFDSLRLKNIDDVVIVRRNDGLWVANVILKKMPVGMPNSFGTPEKHPLASKQEALESAAQNLATAWYMAERNQKRRSETPSSRVFDLEGLEFTFPADAVERAYGAFAELGMADLPQLAEERIRARMDEDFPGQITEAAWDALSEDRRQLYIALMGALLSHGVFRVRRDDAGRRAAAYQESPSGSRH
jgi:hypothetical protein